MSPAPYPAPNLGEVQIENALRRFWAGEIRGVSTQGLRSQIVRDLVLYPQPDPPWSTIIRLQTLGRLRFNGRVILVSVPRVARVRVTYAKDIWSMVRLPKRERRS
jgi:hypothetical protein